ncbi:MAG: phytanoyl-CoA dioxygenase family protein [Gammaproteobacteria bacterium]|nr:phytanoyl-CoA dioxygenase family protein [Gammaproteobacteria bacterium]
MSQSPNIDSMGWAGVDREADHVRELAQYLEANNGLRGLEICEPHDIDRVKRLFHRDGFVVVRDVLDAKQLEFLRAGVDREINAILERDEARSGNRGSHRYSFGGSSKTGHLMHRPEWAMLLDLPTVTPLVTAIFESSDYHARGGGGDFCLPGAVAYQPLHADMSDVRTVKTPSGREIRRGSFHDPRGRMNNRDLPPPNVTCNFFVVDSTPLNGPIRQIPCTQGSQAPIPSLDDEPEWMKLSTLCPAPAGSVLLRDIRTWHGGTPNLADHVRAIPNVEFYAPWFIEPQPKSVPREIHETLSDHARHLCRYIVADRGETLDIGVRDSSFGHSPFA